MYMFINCPLLYVICIPEPTWNYVMSWEYCIHFTVYWQVQFSAPPSFSGEATLQVPMHVLPREERWRGSSAARPLVKRGLCHPLSLKYMIILKPIYTKCWIFMVFM